LGDNQSSKYFTLWNDSRIFIETTKNKVFIRYFEIWTLSLTFEEGVVLITHSYKNMNEQALNLYAYFFFF